MDSSQRNFLRKLCLRSLYYFVEIVIMHAVRNDKNHPRLPLQPFHKEVLDFCEDDTIKRKGILMPRYFLKSTTITCSKPIWDWLRNNEVKSMIVTETHAKAESSLKFIKAQIDKNDLLRYLYPEIIPSDIWKRTHQWSNVAIELPSRGIVKDPSIQVLGVGSAGQGIHVDYMYLDDIIGQKDMLSALEAQNTWSWFINAPELLVTPDVSLPHASCLYLIGCLTGDTNVLLGDGTWKLIANIKPGDIVKSYTISGLTDAVVTAMIPQRIDDIYQISTPHSTIRANAKHPILTIVPTRWHKSIHGGQYQMAEHEIRWIPVQKLQKGDYIISIDSYTDGVIPLYEYNGTKREMCVDFAWLFGFMLGDGWIAPTKHGCLIAFCPGIDESLNQKVLHLFDCLFNKTLKKHNKRSLYQCGSVPLGKVFQQLGFKRGCKNKVIPQWVFQSPINYRIAFIRGLLDADGTRCTMGRESYRIELNNKTLIQQLKYLAYTCGIAVGKIYHRERWSQPPHSPRPILAKSWSISLNFHNDGKMQVAKIPGLQLSLGFRVEKIESKIYTGQEMVYDLSIHQTHNFIAEGLITHNTHYAPDDIYDKVKKRPKLGYQWKCVPAENEEGEPTWPEKLSKDGIREYKEDPDRAFIYYTEMMNDPMRSGVTVFNPDWKKFYSLFINDSGEPCVSFVDQEQLQHTPRILDLDISATIDPAFSSSNVKDACLTAIVIVGVHRETNAKIVLEAWGKKIGEPRQLYEKIFDFHKKYRPRRWGIEAFGPQSFVLKAIRDKANEEEIFLPLRELPRDVGKDAKFIRIESLKEDFATGSIHIHEMQRDLIGEYHSFPVGSHVDILDALAYHKGWWRKVDTEKLQEESKKRKREYIIEAGITGYGGGYS